MADDTPLQLYYSGLVFAPKEAIVRRKFEAEIPDWICPLPRVQETWSSELQTLEGHSHWVQSVAFSPDGALLASGSDDKTVRLWDPAIGALQQILEGHSGWVQSVAFSPDGARLASGSDDRTVRLWDPATGALQQTLEGHSGWVKSVAFSPDGALLASSSGDRTVRLWDPATGALQQTLRINGPVTDVEFDHDGSSLITNQGSFDVQYGSESHATSSNNVSPGILIEQQWIKLNGKNVLWLPPRSRPSCSAINGNLLALGHRSGLISFIGFQV